MSGKVGVADGVLRESELETDVDDRGVGEGVTPSENVFVSVSECVRLSERSGVRVIDSDCDPTGVGVLVAETFFENVLDCSSDSDGWVHVFVEEATDDAVSDSDAEGVSDQLPV